MTDIPAIAAFQTSCWNEAYAGLVPQTYLDQTGIDDRERRWRHRLLHGERCVALAEVVGLVAGVVSWANATSGPHPRLELCSLYVAAEHRGASVAAQLLEHALGGQPAHLWVFRDNPRAQAFYRKHGFDVDGREAVDPDTGLPEVRMSRSAPAPARRRPAPLC